MSQNGVSKPKFTRPYLSAFECILNSEEAIYCSSELTSGRRAYDEMQSRGLKSVSELKEKLGDAWYRENIFDKNAQSANAFAASVRAKRSDLTLVITPAPLFVPGWGQPDYLALWEELIRTRVKEVRFNKNWEFSNGCTSEFAAALETGIPTLDSEGNSLEQGAAVACVEQAVEQLGKDGLDLPKELQDNLERLRSRVGPDPTQGEVVRSPLNLSLTATPRTAPLRRK